MGKISLGGVIIAGLVAGVVFDLLGCLVDAVLLAPRRAEGMKALGNTTMSPNQWIWVSLLGLATGFAMIWIYAAIRPRFGAGVKTAAYAGLAVWVVRSLANISFMRAGSLFSHHLAAYTTAGGLVETVVAAIAGAALYKESTSQLSLRPGQSKHLRHIVQAKAQMGLHDVLHCAGRPDPTLETCSQSRQRLRHQGNFFSAGQYRAWFAPGFALLPRPANQL